MIKNIIKKLRRILFRRYYIVGFVNKQSVCYDGTYKSNDIHWIKYSGYKKNWIADPFILNIDDEYITILAEQWVEATKKGRLVNIKISRQSYKIVDFSIVLEKNTHLSFPIIFEEDEIIYVYPENYESGVLYIYQYNKEKNILEKPLPIINEPLLDPQIIKIDSFFYLFAIKYEGTADENKCLYIYKSPAITGPYDLMQTIVNEKNFERGAGRIIEFNGRYIRPTQNCEGDYGRAVIFNELVLKGNRFYEKRIGTFLPANAYPEGLHTYNEIGDYSVIDGIAYEYGNIITYIKKLKNIRK